MHSFIVIVFPRKPQQITDSLANHCEFRVALQISVQNRTAPGYGSLDLHVLHVAVCESVVCVLKMQQRRALVHVFDRVIQSQLSQSNSGRQIDIDAD